MRRFFENGLAFAAVLSLFSLASSWNAFSGAASTTSPVLRSRDAVIVAHGPLTPPDPWEGNLVAHGPLTPPDPWEGNFSVAAA